MARALLDMEGLRGDSCDCPAQLLGLMLPDAGTYEEFDAVVCVPASIPLLWWLINAIVRMTGMHVFAGLCNSFQFCTSGDAGALRALESCERVFVCNFAAWR